MPAAQRGRLYRRKNKNGKKSRIWWGRIRRAGQKDWDRPLDTETKSIARQRLNKVADELDRTAWGEKPARSLREAVERFGEMHFPKIKHRSAERYLNSIANILRHLPDAMLDDIGSGVLADFELKRRSEGVSNPTIRRDLHCLASIFTQAMIWEWVKHNPVRPYLSGDGLKESPPRERYLSHDEERRVLPAIPLSIRKMAIVSIDTGLRKEELLALMRTSIDLQRREIIVKGETAKNARTRRVPMLPRTFDLVSEMLAAPPRSLYLFHRPDGARHSEKTRNLRRGLLIGAERVGIADLTWHDLRRTCGCRLLQDYKMPLHEVSVWLGHSDVKLTAKRYAFLGSDALHDRIAEAPILKLVKG